MTYSTLLISSLKYSLPSLFYAFEKMLFVDPAIVEPSLKKLAIVQIAFPRYFVVIPAAVHCLNTSSSNASLILIFIITFHKKLFFGGKISHRDQINLSKFSDDINEYP